ncbi:OmpA family protein [uncultured Spirosoma sp.]|uniref:OmpA family protein n=1 Tax=uncultured Spirosoma sp. TaxID=278208 RepID=UPI00258E7F15|nr:OmpA family protein [uncultured Spirosoma sp.]
MKQIVCNLLLGWGVVVGSTGAFAQQGEFGDVLNSLMNTGLIRGMIRNEPITTSMRDVNKRVDLPDSFGNDQTFRPLHRYPRTPTGGWKLVPGFYELRSRSYCIKAGTHAPSNGDGYLYAPLRGRQADIVQSILAGSAVHTEVDQHDVQLLLWAIIARSNFSNMNSRVVGVASTFLNPGQMLRLNSKAMLSTALQLLNSPQLEASLRPIFAAEHQIRQVVGQMNARFEDVEKLAMLAGPALMDNPDIRQGRWSKHPDGYYVRYFPHGYSRTIVQVYVPANVSTVVFDATDDVAVPANTGAQRLALSNVPYDTTGYAPDPPPVVARQQPATREQIPVPPVLPSPTVRYQQICGLVIDTRTRMRISGASIMLGDHEILSDGKGTFRLDSLVAGQTIGFTTGAAGYSADTLEIDVERRSDCQTVVIELKPITKPDSGRLVALNEADLRAGDRIILQNIQFEQSRSELLVPGKSELDKVAAWMQVHTTARVELSGHTSNEGDKSANLALSKERAAACKRYLLRKGVGPDRIKAVGYGQERPIVSNDTPERTLNRRVELRIDRL